MVRILCALSNTCLKKYLHFNCINLKGRELKEVDTFSYLGSVVTSNTKIQNEVNESIKIVLSCKG